jgi:hypothetical protein
LPCCKLPQSQLYLIGQKRFPQDSVKAVFASDFSNGRMAIERGGDFFLARRKAKQARRAGVRVATVRAVQLGLRAQAVAA